MSIAAYAKPIKDGELKNVAKNWLYKKSGDDVKVKNIITSKNLLKKAGSTYVSKDETFYVVQFKSKGWAIVSADDVAKPIIGYSKEGTFDADNLPPQLTWMLESFAKQIDTYAQQETQEIPLDTAFEWENLKQESETFKEKNVKTKSASLLRTTLWSLDSSAELSTPTWDQKKYYNDQTPYDINSPYNNHAPTGCVATVMAEIMRYYSWPNQGSGSHSYTSNYGVLSANFGATTYDWSSMPFGKVTSTNPAVATIMYHAGIAVDMNYGPTTSGAFYSDDAMKNYFKYWSQRRFKDNYYSNESDWHSYLRTDLRKGHPVAYSGGSPGEIHAFILDGFDIEGDFYKMNFGGNGALNDWFTLDDITPGIHDFTASQDAQLYIKPNNSTYRDHYEPDNTWKKSSYIRVGKTVLHVNAGYSINPKTDTDYTWFWNDTAGKVTIETYNSSGDTDMWLYNYYGNQVAHDDDSGSGHLSKISTNLDVGRYYIKVTSYDSSSTISSYDLKVYR